MDQIIEVMQNKRSDMPTQHWMYGKLPDSGIDLEIELEIESAQELEEASREKDSNL